MAFNILAMALRAFGIPRKVNRNVNLGTLSASGNSEWIDVTSPFGSSHSFSYSGSGDFAVGIRGTDSTAAEPPASKIFPIGSTLGTLSPNVTPLTHWPLATPCNKIQFYWVCTAGTIDAEIDNTTWEL